MKVTCMDVYPLLGVDRNEMRKLEESDPSLCCLSHFAYANRMRLAGRMFDVPQRPISLTQHSPGNSKNLNRS